MDSSRNGLLSTLLMTLPLIAVPAMALLRPPGQATVSPKSLDASEESADEFLDGTEDESASDSTDDLLFEEELAPRKSAKSTRKKKSEEPDFDGLFDEVDQPDDVPKKSRKEPRKAPLSSRKDSSEESKNSSPPADPFMEADDSLGMEGPEKKKAPEDSEERSVDSDNGFGGEPENATPKPEEIVEQLTSLGALRTSWFDGGERFPVGFAVYFRGRSESEQIRFEHTGQTREECARNVLQQVEEWHQRREKSKSDR